MVAGYPYNALPQPQLARTLSRWAWFFTAFITLAVVAMRYISLPLPEGVSFTWLPPVYSTLNALAGTALIFSLYYIKRGNVEAHRKANLIALGFSVLFILGYVLYHITNPTTPYGGTGTIRTIYFVLLISHIVLAAVSLPLILFTFIRAYTGMIAAHRRMARIVYPIWLYVCITGPILYFMIAPYYNH